MAKREEKKSSKQQSRTDAVRAAVDQAFQATADQAEGTQRRVQEMADELSSVAGRLRDALEGSRPATTAELEVLRTEIAGLSTRVQALERSAGGSSPKAPKAARRTPVAKPSAPVKAGATRTAPPGKKRAKGTPAKPAPAKTTTSKPSSSRGGTSAGKVTAARAAARRSANGPA